MWSCGIRVRKSKTILKAQDYIADICKTRYPKPSIGTRCSENPDIGASVQCSGRCIDQDVHSIDNQVYVSSIHILPERDYADARSMSTATPSDNHIK
ncbi:hypothetical protein GGI08_007597 [Coemansia sp. S2]|nr:hypothetical protein GGI08_007597 [Coemansia sp. S2]